MNTNKTAEALRLADALEREAVADQVATGHGSSTRNYAAHWLRTLVRVGGEYTQNRAAEEIALIWLSLEDAGFRANSCNERPHECLRRALTGLVSSGGASNG